MTNWKNQVSKHLLNLYIIIFDIYWQYHISHIFVYSYFHLSIFSCYSYYSNIIIIHIFMLFILFIYCYYSYFHVIYIIKMLLLFIFLWYSYYLNILIIHIFISSYFQILIDFMDAGSNPANERNQGNSRGPSRIYLSRGRKWGRYIPLEWTCVR